MLIIITGADSINKRLIARQITSKCNEYNVEGFKLDFSADPYNILDEKNNPIDILEFIKENPDENKKILESANILYEEFLKFEKKNYHSEQFLDIGYDLGVFQYPEHATRTDARYSNEKTINEIVKKYKKSKMKYYVITGNFSKTAIKILKFKLGDENVKVLNFLRNPSVGYFLNKKYDDFFEKNQFKNKKEDDQKYVSSLLNSIFLSEIEGVETIKFEDYIKKDFYIDNINTGLYLDYNYKNNYLTTYEFDIKKDLIEMSEEEMNDFNNKMLSFNIYDDVDEHEKINIIKFDLPPINIFERLGYEPLTIKEICSL
jgi:hypothetical protein